MYGQHLRNAQYFFLFPKCVSTFRWAQVTQELKEALWELEAEKEKRRCVEEEINIRAQEQDNLKNKLSALTEEKEKATDVMLLGQDADSGQRVEEKQLHNQQVQLY